MGKISLGLAAPHNPNITSRPDKMSPEVQGKLDSAFGHLLYWDCAARRAPAKVYPYYFPRTCLK